MKSTEVGLKSAKEGSKCAKVGGRAMCMKVKQSIRRWDKVVCEVGCFARSVRIWDEVNGGGANCSEVGWTGGRGFKDDKNNLFSYIKTPCYLSCAILFTSCLTVVHLVYGGTLLAWSKPLRVVQR
jgi:hypothetical protein